MEGSLYALSILVLAFLVSNVLPDNTIQQVFYLEDRLDLHKEFSSYHYTGSFPVLSVLPSCETSKLTTCLINGNDAKRYFNYCFETNFTFENYYCVETSNSTLHFGAELDKCGKRQRRIAVLNHETAKVIKIYTVMCPDGYIQDLQDKCTYPCTKDDSIVLHKFSTKTSPATAYCATENDMCNPHKETVFEIGSEKDDCVSASVSCYTKELLPDCSCAEPCPLGQTRTPESKFRCTIPSIDNAGKSEAEINGTVQETDQNRIDINVEKEEKEVEDNTKNATTTDKQDSHGPQNGSNEQGNQKSLIICIAVFVIIILLVLLIWFACHICRKRNNNNQRHSTTVYVWKNFKQIIKNTFSIHTEQNVDIHVGEADIASDAQSDFSRHTADQRLLDLKEHPIDSASTTRLNSSDSETKVLKPVNSLA